MAIMRYAVGMTKQSTALCPHCQEQVLSIGTKPNHFLHLFLSFLTIGLWTFVWIAIAIAKAGNFRCSKCGTPV